MSQSLKQFHLKLERQIKLLGEYLHQRKLMPMVVKMCRLRPIEFWTESKPIWQIKLYQHWVDEYGNSLKTKSMRQMQVVPYDLELRSLKFGTTDLYEMLPAAQLRKISQVLIVLTGKDELEGSDHYLLMFYGMDGYLRVHSYLHQQWQNIPPLLVGMPIWKMVAAGLKSKTNQEVMHSEPVIFPCTHQQVWVYQCPLTLEAKTQLRQTSETLTTYLGLDYEQ
jgi:hypothetical protein